MSISVNQVTIGTAATLIVAATNSDKAEITISTKGKDVYIGKSDVSLTNGLQLQAGSYVTFKVGRGDALYGVVDTATHVISYVMYTPN